MGFEGKSFTTPEFTFSSGHLAAPRVSKMTDSDTGKQYDRKRYDFRGFLDPENNEEHKTFLETYNQIQESQGSTKNYIETKKNAVKNHNTGEKEFIDDPQGRKTLTFENLTKERPVVMELDEGTGRFFEAEDLNIPYGSTIVVEGDLNEWEFNGGKGVKLVARKLKIIKRRVREEQTAKG